MENKSLLDAVYGPFDKGEHELLYGSNNMYGIYQLKDNEYTDKIKFQNMDFLKRKDISVSKDNYNLVYTAQLKENIGLERLFIIFNSERPDDFKGHSMSVGDVVVLNQGGKVTSHFVDSFGFAELPDFAFQDRTYDKDKSDISYYVISDIDTWSTGEGERAALERFDSQSDAIARFSECISRDDNVKSTFGLNVKGNEFDFVYAEGYNNTLSLDFTYNDHVLHNESFQKEFEELCYKLEVSRVKVHRMMSPDEVKDFTRQRFKAYLETTNTKSDDINYYMSNFDRAYDAGRLNNYVPNPNLQRIDEVVPFADWIVDNEYFKFEQPTEIAYTTDDNRAFTIQQCDDGYDYSVYDKDFNLIDGGVYDNPDVSIYSVKYIVLNEYLLDCRELVEADFDEINELGEQKEVQKIQDIQVVKDFKDRTDRFFYSAEGFSATTVENIVRDYVEDKIDEYGLDINVVDLAIDGSRCRGLENNNSDLDIVVEFSGNEKEDYIFDLLHEDAPYFDNGHVPVDINPINAEQSGTLAEYLSKAEVYLQDKAQKLGVVLESASKPKKVEGSLDKWEIPALASDIDNFMYDFDPEQYKDNVSPDIDLKNPDNLSNYRKARVAEITDNLKSGFTSPYLDYLSGVSESAVLQPSIRYEAEFLRNKVNKLDSSQKNLSAPEQNMSCRRRKGI